MINSFLIIAKNRDRYLKKLKISLNSFIKNKKLNKLKILLLQVKKDHNYFNQKE